MASRAGRATSRYCRGLAEVSCDIVRPADGEVRLAAADLGSYDGVAITGSALNVYDGGAPVERQIELARAVFAAGVPFFGSCWGLQVAVIAAGGRVRRNPLGREFGFARRIELSACRVAATTCSRASRRCSRRSRCTATTSSSCRPAPWCWRATTWDVQAMEVRHGRGTFWGVQYHPEYSFAEIAATTLRYGETLIRRACLRTVPSSRPLSQICAS